MLIIRKEAAAESSAAASGVGHERPPPAEPEGAALWKKRFKSGRGSAPAAGSPQGPPQRPRPQSKGRSRRTAASPLPGTPDARTARPQGIPARRFRGFSKAMQARKTSSYCSLSAFQRTAWARPFWLLASVSCTASHSQAATAASVPSDTAVVSCRTVFCRQSPAAKKPGVAVSIRSLVRR